MTAIDSEAPTTEVVYATPAAVAPMNTSASMVLPAAELDAIAHAFTAYQSLSDRLLVDSDYQQIGTKAFKKKSAWRKLAVAFNVSTKIVSVTHERDARGRIIRTEVISLATAPNGRTEDGIGSCDVFEKCCDPATCTKWTHYEDSGKPTGHVHCEPDCPGTIHFSHAQHDIPGTAETRSKNRALSNLFGYGEVSAEEVLNDDGTESPHAAPHADTARQRAQQSARPDEPITTVSASGKPGGQLGFVNSLLGRTGVEMFDLTSVIGREVVVAAELTKSEAKKVIEYLQGVENGTNPRPASEGPPPERRSTAAGSDATAEPRHSSGPSPAGDVAPLGRLFQELGIPREDRHTIVQKVLDRDLPLAWGGSLTDEDVAHVIKVITDAKERSQCLLSAACLLPDGHDGKCDDKF